MLKYVNIAPNGIFSLTITPVHIDEYYSVWSDNSIFYVWIFYSKVISLLELIFYFFIKVPLHLASEKLFYNFLFYF